MIITSKDIVGKTEKEVYKFFKKLQVSWRLSKKDGVSFMLTRDYQPLRINLEIRDGIVTGYNYG